jgi:glycosyltransferase involved in cell wall biosynthesis
MRILVYPHDMGMGGSQLNAIELAAAVRNCGHEVIVVGQPGALQSKIAELELEFIQLPRPGRRPHLPIVRFLKQLVRERGIDIVHGYEWPPALEALLSCSRTTASPVVTVLSMSVAPFIPRHLPLMVGTEQIAQAEREFGRSFVRLMEPPVDVISNSPECDLPINHMARRWGIHRNGLTLAIVSRLAHEMKLEGILSAINLVGKWNGDQPLQLLVVGSGPAHDEVAATARLANEVAGEKRIVLTGEVADPRWAYALGDIILGMGGSALRGMAMGKPLIVQGEKGFWKTLNPDSVDDFLWQGWYGVGPGKEYGEELLRGELLPLVEDREGRERLGGYSRTLVHERFSLDQAAARQIGYYNEARTERAHRGAMYLSTLQGACGLFGYEVRRLGERIRGTMANDDFNAIPVVGKSHEAREAGPR